MSDEVKSLDADFVAKPESFLTYVCREMHWSYPDPDRRIPTERCARCHYISFCPRCQTCRRISTGFCDGKFEDLVKE